MFNAEFFVANGFHADFRLNSSFGRLSSDRPREKTFRSTEGTPFQLKSQI